MELEHRRQEQLRGITVQPEVAKRPRLCVCAVSSLCLQPRSGRPLMATTVSANVPAMHPAPAAACGGADGRTRTSSAKGQVTSNGSNRVKTICAAIVLKNTRMPERVTLDSASPTNPLLKRMLGIVAWNPSA